MYLLPIAEDELSAEEAIGAIKGHAFIDDRIDSVLFSIHRLVRLATQNWIKTEGDWGACIDEFVQHLIKTCPSSQNVSNAIKVFTTCVRSSGASRRYQKQNSITISHFRRGRRESYYWEIRHG